MMSSTEHRQRIGQRSRRRPEVADTSILIPFFRYGTGEADLEAAIQAGRSHLSSLVALELYAGTRDLAEKRALDRFVGSFERRGLVVIPTHQDHVLAGMLLARRRRLAGDLAARIHIVDVLIVLSTAQLGGTVVTWNVRHLETWASLARRAGRDVRVRAPTAPI